MYTSAYLDPDTSPSTLQRKVMFDIRYYICHQGGENIKDLIKEMFQLHFDTETKMSYVKKVVDKIQKNHQEYDSEIITGFMPQIQNISGVPHKVCPVRSFEMYLNNLHADNKFLWQKAFTKFHLDGKPWYQTQYT